MFRESYLVIVRELNITYMCFCSKTLQRILKKQGLDFKLKTKVTSAVKTSNGIQV